MSGFFSSKCILSQKMTQRTVAIMGLKAVETWERPKVQLCTGLDGAKNGLEQPFEAIAVGGLPPEQYLGFVTQKMLKQLGKVTLCLL